MFEDWSKNELELFARNSYQLKSVEEVNEY